MIRFLNPGFAWMLAAPAVIVALYLLRRRFLPRQVPSVFLWRRSLRDYAANRPFQKLMKNLLLPLQLLAALALALALMDPVLPGGTAGRSILVFDVSGSMQTESAGRTRLELAKEEALRRIREMPAEEKITVITAGDEVRRLVLNAGREEAEQAVASVACGRGGAEIDRALALAYALGRNGSSGTDDRVAAVTVFSDALRMQDIHTRGDGNVPAVINVGEPAENRAVYSLMAENGKAYARVANFGKECKVTVVCEADGTICGATEITIPAGETAGIGFDIPETAEKIRVSLKEKDALEADNAAEAAVTRRKSLRVAVTENSVFLESALKVRPDLTVIRTETESLPSTEADLYILGNGPMILTTRLPEEGYDPAAVTFGPFGWEADPSIAPGTAREPAAEVLDGPLTAGVTMKEVFFRSWRPITGGQAAVMLGEDPVIAWTADTAVLGFDIHETNLPLKYDFPVLIQNMLNTLLTDAEEGTGNNSESQGILQVMPLAESDTRDTAPSLERDRGEQQNEHGRKLKDMLLVLFLLLLVAEMGVSRYVS